MIKSSVCLDIRKLKTQIIINLDLWQHWIFPSTGLRM